MDDDLHNDARTMTVRVPLAFKKRGGRKMVISPVDAPSWVPPRRRIESAMVKAIARAFRWREMLENGTHATIAEIAAAEKINESYVSRVLRLALLAPDIVELIVEGRQPAGVSLAMLLMPFPVCWQQQKRSLAFTC